MNRTELMEIIRNGENSGVEFKRDDVQPVDLAKEIVAFLNFQGGIILLGIDDDGTIRGTTRQNLEEWVMNICRDKVKPEVIPYYEKVEIEGKVIAVCTFSQGLYVHHRWHNQHRYYYIRVGSTSREASPEELQRLFQQRGQIRFDLKSVSGATFDDLDMLRLKNYFRNIRGQDILPDDVEAWQQLLFNTEIMVVDQDRIIPSVGGILLFGKNPNHYLPQAGISAVAYKGQEKDYNTTERGIIRGPVVARFNEAGEIVDTGLVERAIEFVRRNTGTRAYLVEGRRIDKPDYPEEVIRETIVNAIAHRDYTISGTDIELSIYSDRLEVISPGRLPNTVTVERMKAGCRATRNELIKEILRDYHYVEATGLGVPRKIIAGMLKHNGIEPDLIGEEYSFMVRLWREKSKG
ncbi:ATP-dependent DNA helicase RecG [Peptococcaceae bacterium SCADC1_2_3]|nr:ATP-dependent DNA helicase RecG [Peptococcaceae bacterium SCADC1_2_3]KFI36549.1 ATP-dependent DNA helicase RecG [Peptococcaceae bacterium SCADC1_2_3]